MKRIDLDLCLLGFEMVKRITIDKLRTKLETFCDTSFLIYKLRRHSQTKSNSVTS